MAEGHLSGVFPRSAELVETTRAAERGRATLADVDRAFYSDVQSLIALQSQCSLEYRVDGQLNWQDLFRPFSELFTGIRLGSLTRWFDNNTFYRKPIIVEKVGFRGTSLEQYFRYDLLPRGAARKAILPGPFTFAYMSQNNTYSTRAELVDDIAHGLKDLVAALRKAGYSYFQFNEPALCFNKTTKEELETARKAFEICARGIGAKSDIQTYFGDAGSIIPDILDFSVDCIGLDFYSTSIEQLKEYDFDKELGCGCIDGRNSLLESPDELVKFIAGVRQVLEPKRLFVSPNCDLEFLPYPVAAKKVALLSKVKKMLE